MASFHSSFKLDAMPDPTAFDWHAKQELLYVCNSQGINAFHMNSLASGAPKVVIHYEQPQIIRKISASHSHYLTVLRGGTLSVWDTGNPLKPLKTLIAGPFLDFQNSVINENILCGCCENGDLLMHDLRMASYAHHISFGTMSHRPFTQIDILQENVALSNESLLQCLDMRYLGLKPNETLCSVDFPSPINALQQHLWCDPSTIAVSTLNGDLSFYNVNSELCFHTRSIGGGAPQTLLRTPSPLSILSCCSSRRPLHRRPSRNTVEEASSHSSSSSSSQVLLPLAAPSLKLTLHKVPSTEEHDEEEKEEGKEPFIDLAMMNDSLVGMAVLGISGQLIPPFDTGVEILLLSPSSVLHAIKIHESVLSFTPLNALHPSTSTSFIKERAYSNATSSSITSVAQRAAAAPTYELKAMRRVLSHNEHGAMKTISSEYFLGPLRREVLSLQEKIESGEYSGLSVANVDPYAQQVTLSMTASSPSEDRTNPLNLRRIRSDLSTAGNGAPYVNLIISFPPSFPLDGLPTFTLRSSEWLGGKIESASLTAELLLVVKHFVNAKPSEKSSKVMLLEVLYILFI